jgi:aldehyde dehydrogenase (NAD+)
VLEHLNPATGKVNKAVALASADELDEAVAAARTALVEWRRWTPDARRDVLLKLADLMEASGKELGTIVALEGGQPFSVMAGWFPSLWFRYYAGWADKITGERIDAFPMPGLDFTVPEPVGVVGLFVASNGPLGFCAMGGAPALAAGCCLVIKSPEIAPFSALTFGRLCQEAGLPPGVVNVVNGGPEIGHAIASHPGIDKISFTGGVATARKLQAACADTLKPMVMELGGKSANVVFADADLAAVIPQAARWTFNAGQGCTMPTRLLVERPVYERVIDGVADLVGRVVVGLPFDDGVTMGPVITEVAANRIVDMVKDAKDSGAGRVIMGGERIGGELASGFFVEPTVLVDVDNTAPIAQTELFGPVLCVMPFDDEDEAVALANGTDYGLAAYAHTRDMARARRLIGSLQAGNVQINNTGPVSLSPAAPFGGIKQSGYGRQGSRLGIEEFLSIKNVYLNF